MTIRHLFIRIRQRNERRHRMHPGLMHNSTRPVNRPIETAPNALTARQGQVPGGPSRPGKANPPRPVVPRVERVIARHGLKPNTATHRTRADVHALSPRHIPAKLFRRLALMDRRTLYGLHRTPPFAANQDATALTTAVPMYLRKAFQRIDEKQCLRTYQCLPGQP